MILIYQKEAEGHLPDLDSRDGITIAMEDIGTSQVWNMRYRYKLLLNFIGIFVFSMILCTKKHEIQELLFKSSVVVLN